MKLAEHGKTAGGLVAFDQGYAEPLNQVLIFLELYSEGTDSSRFYRVHVGDPTIQSQDVTLRRDAMGRIDRVTVGGTSWTFTLDGAGNVTAYVLDQ